MGRGATLKVGSGGSTSDSKWGRGTKTFFLINSLYNFQKVCVVGEGGDSSPLPLPFRGPCHNDTYFHSSLHKAHKDLLEGGGLTTKEKRKIITPETKVFVPR